MKWMLYFILIILMSTTIRFSDHQANVNRVYHENMLNTNTHSAKQAKDTEGTLTALTATQTLQIEELDGVEDVHQWPAVGRVKNSDDSYEGNWILYGYVPYDDNGMGTGPDTFGDYRGTYDRSYSLLGRVQGEIRDARQTIDLCHIGATISGWQGSPYEDNDLADSRIPW